MNGDTPFWVVGTEVKGGVVAGLRAFLTGWITLCGRQSRIGRGTGGGTGGETAGLWVMHWTGSSGADCVNIAFSPFRSNRGAFRNRYNRYDQVDHSNRFNHFMTEIS
jgi:hypothetical protein